MKRFQGCFALTVAAVPACVPSLSGAGELSLGVGAVLEEPGRLRLRSEFGLLEMSNGLTGIRAGIGLGVTRWDLLETSLSLSRIDYGEGLPGDLLVSLKSRFTAVRTGRLGLYFIGALGLQRSELRFGPLGNQHIAVGEAAWFGRVSAGAGTSLAVTDRLKIFAEGEFGMSGRGGGADQVMFSEVTAGLSFDL